MEKKKCAKCKKYKDVSDFAKDHTRKVGLQSYCRTCNKNYKRKYDDSEYQKFYRDKHAEDLKEKRKWSRYPNRVKLKKLSLSENFTADEWKEKVDETGGMCARCGKTYEEGSGLTINHTPDMSKAPKGFVYSIDDVEPMCHSCNVSLFASNNVRFKKTIKYGFHKKNTLFKRSIF